MNKYLTEKEQIEIVEKTLKEYLEAEIIGNNAEAVTPIKCRTELTYTECSVIDIDKMKNDFEISRDIIDNENVKMPIIIMYEKLTSDLRTAMRKRVFAFWGDIQFK